MEQEGLGAILPRPLVLCLPWSNPSALGLASSSSLQCPRATCKAQDLWMPTCEWELDGSTVKQKTPSRLYSLTSTSSGALWDARGTWFPFCATWGEFHGSGIKLFSLEKIGVLKEKSQLPLIRVAVRYSLGERQSSSWHFWKTCQQSRFLFQTEINTHQGKLLNYSLRQEACINDPVFPFWATQNPSFSIPLLCVCVCVFKYLFIVKGERKTERETESHLLVYSPMALTVRNGPGWS